MGARWSGLRLHQGVVLSRVWQVGRSRRQGSPQLVNGARCSLDANTWQGSAEAELHLCKRRGLLTLRRSWEAQWGTAAPRIGGTRSPKNPSRNPTSSPSPTPTFRAPRIGPFLLPSRGAPLAHHLPSRPPACTASARFYSKEAGRYLLVRSLLVLNLLQCKRGSLKCQGGRAKRQYGIMPRPRHPTNTQISLLRVPAPRNCAKFSAEPRPDRSPQGQPQGAGARPPTPLQTSLGKTSPLAGPDTGGLSGRVFP